MDEQNKTPASEPSGAEPTPPAAPVTEAQAAAPQRLAPKGRGGKLAAIIAGGVVAVLLAGYLAVCALASSTEVILPNTTVAGIPVGGMSQEELEDTLRQTQDLWANGSQDDTKGILVQVKTDSGEAVMIKVPSNYIRMDVENTVRQTWEKGRGVDTDFLVKGVHYLKCLISGQELAPTYEDGGKLDALLTEQLDAVSDQTVVESSYAVEENQLVLTRGQPGRGVDQKALKMALFDMMAKGETVDLNAGEANLEVAYAQTMPEDLDWEALINQVCTDPQDATFHEETGDFSMEVVGISFDQVQAQNSFNTLNWGESCKVPLVLTEPKVKFTDLEGLLYRDTLGSCSSNIGGSSNRLANVKLAASFCNEKVLAPGEEFSYNGTVGRRTTARGFLPAPAYVAGQTVDEVGGGICQVSSTLYLATLRSNLNIAERHNHGFTVGYVPNGLDATVYYGSLDFRFKNDTEFPIKIVASVSERTLTVKILGTKTSEWSVEMKTEQYSNKGYDTVYKVDNNVSPGKTKTSVSPYSGCTVDAYRCVYDGDGELISRTHESTSRYKSRDKVILVNEADAYKYGIGEPPAPTPEQPVEQPTEQPVEQPTEQPVEQPTEQPVVQPTEQPVEQPTEQPVEQPTEQPVEQPTEQPVEQPTEPIPEPTAHEG